MTPVLKKLLSPEIQRWIALTVASACISLGGTWLMKKQLGWPTWLASAVALITAAAVTFISCRYFVFEDHGETVVQQLAKFVPSAAFFRTCEWTALNGLVYWLGDAKWFYIMVSVQVVSSVTKFFWYRLVVFKRTPEVPVEPVETAASA